MRFATPALLLAFMIAVCFAPSIAGRRNLRGQKQFEKSCGGLHAGIHAEVIRRDPNYSRPSVVMVTMVLLNDGDTPFNSIERGWSVVIDGKYLSDSSSVLDNRFQPGGILNPGESYQLAAQLEISKYFPELGEHTLSWKGQGFHSSTIKVEITPQ